MGAKGGAKKAAHMGGSAAGFHYFNLWQNCPKKFFYAFVLRLTYRFTALPLIMGHANHEAFATFYQTGSQSKALRAANSDVRMRRLEFETKDEYEACAARVPLMVAAWIKERGRRDLESYDFLGIEEELSASLPGTKGFVVTARLDARVRDGFGNAYLVEHKNTQYSMTETAEALKLSDQVSIQMLVCEANNVPVKGVMGDIVYWNKVSTNPDKIACSRTQPIKRSKTALASTAAQLSQISTEISQRVRAFESGMSPDVLFPRNTFYCRVYGKNCEFAAICWTNFWKQKRIPVGFKRNTAIKGLGSLGRYVEDMQWSER